jgi:hypothetical protein
MNEHHDLCVVCLQNNCRLQDHQRSTLITNRIVDVMALTEMLERHEPSEIQMGALRVRLIVDPAMPPGEVRMVCGPRREQQVRVTGLAE